MDLFQIGRKILFTLQHFAKHLYSHPGVSIRTFFTKLKNGHVSI